MCMFKEILSLNIAFFLFERKYKPEFSLQINKFKIVLIDHSIDIIQKFIQKEKSNLEE